MRARSLAWWLVVCSMFAAARAEAQHGGDLALDGFRAPMDTNGYVTVDGAATTPAGSVAFGLYTTWARGLLDAGAYEVKDVMSPTLVASIGLPRVPVAVGLSVPFGVVAGVRDDERITAQGLGEQPPAANGRSPMCAI